MKDMGVTLPRELHEMIHLGWITPVLRVRIPAEFYLAWENYPAYQLQGTIADEHFWAAELRGRSAFLGARWYGDRDASGNWYCHFLDDPASELGRQARAHSIAVGSQAEEPPQIEHPRRRAPIYPWIDYFSFWQVYELVEILDDLAICGQILDTPEVELTLEAVRRNLPRLRENSRLGIQGKRQRWARNAPVFDWLSRYRTLLAISTRTPLTPSQVDEGAGRLLRDCGLTPEQLREDIRDVLLQEWQRLANRLPQSAREHFREDIMRAVQFYEAVTGREADYADPYWAAPADRMNRGFTPLAEVLPFEALLAKWSFPEQAIVYLGNKAQAMGPMSEERLQTIAGRWFPESVQFRRFCMAFKRLHDDYSSFSEDRIGLRAQTPIEFLILCCLHAEKLLQTRYGERRPGEPLPKGRKLFAAMYGEVLYERGLPDHRTMSDELLRLLSTNGRDQLHDLPQRPRNPFIVAQEITWGNGVTSALAIALGNLVILRNYAAHHDVLDDMLLGDPSYANPAIEAVLVPTVLVLEIGVRDEAPSDQ
ncbi:MAG TPA: hypothetical protein VN999_03430 [Thermoanaerobaculia bacterium]|nr:hypothetical protein [Thermoanaerobaculia bacterium]